MERRDRSLQHGRAHVTKLEKKHRRKARKNPYISVAEIDARMDKTLRSKLLSFDYEALESRMSLLFGTANLWPWQENLVKKFGEGGIVSTVTGRFRAGGPNQAGVVENIPVPDKLQYVNRLQRGDLHSEKAAELFGVAVENVTPEQRAEGKRNNFMEMYGKKSPTTLLLDDRA